MDPELKDLVLRSRPIILEILELRGFNISDHKDIAPNQLINLISDNEYTLRIRVKRPGEPSDKIVYATVVYFVMEKIRMSVKKKVEFLVDLDINPKAINSKTDEIIAIINEPYHDAFNQVALQMLGLDTRISFFHIKQLIVNPTKHEAVPKHEKLTPDEFKEVMKKYHIRSRNDLPLIRFHYDMQSRVLGLVPGDVVKITRLSPTRGEYVLYRLCAP